jgi:hypothetical protein
MGQQPPRRVSGGFARDHSSGLHEPLRLVATIVLAADVSLSGNLDHRTFPTSWSGRQSSTMLRSTPSTDPDSGDGPGKSTPAARKENRQQSLGCRHFFLAALIGFVLPLDDFTTTLSDLPDVTMCFPMAAVFAETCFRDSSADDVVP